MKHPFAACGHISSVGVLFLAASLSACARGANNLSFPSSAAARTELTPEARLSRGEIRLRASEYAGAEADLRAAATTSLAPRANLGLAELFLVTGRWTEAVEAARQARQADATLVERANVVAAQALRESGALEAARAELLPLLERPNARAVKLAAAEIELATGHRKAATPLLMSLIEDFNQGRIAESDATGLALTARAAWLLRSPRDANTLFDAAEKAREGDVQTMLWRVELFLEKYDPAHAEEVLREVFEIAPRHPEALTWLAHVRLAQALDFDEAERLAREALKRNPKLTRARFVLGGIALRDMELDAADREIERGLADNPRDLDLLSLRATVRFLADDEAGFAAAKGAVLKENPEYARLYAILGEYADWEHRYEEIVQLMREALRIDAEDAGALAQLGLNLIRANEESEGVSALSRAFALDPYNVRVFNTLNLFDTLIPKAYVSVRHPRFVIRYHKDDRELLERYVPALLDQAFDAMRTAYGFSPGIPIGIELYAERESFAIRTGGLPQTAIQGVCFGKTLAAMSPQKESFNLGMTLWHELSHVFHIQLSKSRVPRWFTEGLAEYETLTTRAEWSRQNDPELYELVRAKKLPEVLRMSRAFTRAEALSDIATAYYASTKIVEMLASQHGRGKMAEMLQLWGQGRRTQDVFQQALGENAETIDRRFREQVQRSLVRYDKQFVPLSRARPEEAVASMSRAAPRNLALLVELALARIRAEDADGARAAIQNALKVEPKNAQARYLKARLSLALGEPDRSADTLLSMLKDGIEGFSIHMALAEIARARGDTASARAAFEQAHRLDPTQADPLIALADIAAAEKVPEDELSKLTELAKLSAHAPIVHRRLLRLLLDKKRFPEAVRAGEVALWADVNGLWTHVLFAEALAETGDLVRARYELESAVLCPEEPAALAEAHARLSEVLMRLKNPREARRARETARKLDPANERLKGQPTP